MTRRRRAQSLLVGGLLASLAGICGARSGDEAVPPGSAAALAPATVPSDARAAIAPPPPGFVTAILPILTKAGCNGGACHGAATGQGGFRLSLLGYDPPADYHAITREFAGRRIDLGSPVESLFVRKGTGRVRHKGGERIEPGSADEAVLLGWIGGGTEYGPADLRVTAIAVDPPDALLAGPGASVRLKVTATHSDGTAADVTRHALYTSNDDGVAVADEAGAVTLVRRGPATVMVRYGGQVAAARVASPLGDAAVPAGALPVANVIDALVLAELRRLRVPPGRLSDDAEFLRRAHLDITGRLPSADAVRAFTAEPSTPASRSAVVRRLAATAEATDLWTAWLADLLRIDSKRLGAEPARAYHRWVREQVARNRPMDEVVRELLTTTGDGATVGPANFYRAAQDPRDLAEFVGGALLGQQVACARCHAHPFARWTQDDYYGFAARFAQVRQDGRGVRLDPRGEIPHPRTQTDATPRPLGGAVTRGAERLPALADWVLAPENPAFARATANRVWRQMMGRGLVEPVDDHRATNPPTHPALLDALAADFVAGGYDLRRLVVTIAESTTYQLSSVASDGNRRDDRLYSHARAKPLPAAVLADAVAQATGVADVYPGAAAGTRAVQLVDARTPSAELDVLGRCTREAGCESRPRAGGLPQALHLINGTTINGKLHGGVVEALAATGRTDAERVEELYLRTLSRRPTAKERAFCEAQLARAGSKRDAIADLLWALLNSREFGVNH